MSNGICRICGKATEGAPFTSWVKDTFTNYDLLHPGEIICDACLFWFDQHSTDLQHIMGKDKPQKMQNYSHFVIGGEWMPVSKGDKPQMTRLLLANSFPELAAIAVSGQKHIAFRARRNPPNQSNGWIQFEEQSVWVDQDRLTAMLAMVEELYTVFSKGEIESGNYFPKRILDFGMQRWLLLEETVKPIRKTILFQLALFLAQRSDDDTRNDSNLVDANLAAHTARLQSPLPYDDLEPIRERDPLGGVHQQPGQVHQLDLFKIEGESRGQREGARAGRRNSTHRG